MCQARCLIVENVENVDNYAYKVSCLIIGFFVDKLFKCRIMVYMKGSLLGSSCSKSGLQKVIANYFCNTDPNNFELLDDGRIKATYKSEPFQGLFWKDAPNGRFYLMKIVT